jgi:ribosomal protein S18 acetylase RimI-like enzyme
MVGLSEEMKNDISLSIADSLDATIVEQLRNSLFEFNRAHAGHDDHKNLLIPLKDESGKTIGGIIGGTYFGYLHIDILWVDEEHRREGLGERLLLSAEQEAIRRGCRYAHLDTHGFQALPFYEKHGYHVVGELKDLPPGDSKYLMRKELTD